MPRAIRMANADAAWLGMDEPENLMMITAVLWFAEPMDWSRLRDVVVVRLLERYPKFSRRAVPSGSPWEQPVWADDPAFCLDDHLVATTLPAPGGDGELRALVSGLMGRPLDMAHSPWQFHLVSGYAGGAALVARLHHCIADGIALGSVLLSLTDGARDEPLDDGGGPAGVGDARRPGLTRRVASGVAEVAGVAGAALAGAAALGFGVRVARAGFRILCFTRDPRTRLHGRLGTRKGAAWTRPHALDEIKAVARALGCSVNDVMLAVTAGALRRFLLDHGDRAHDLRVFVPVNLRPPDQQVPAELGNRFGVVFVKLPVAEPDPVARVRAVRARMQAVRASSEAAATFALLSVLGAIPAWAHGLAVRLIGAKSTAVVTNVPGPREPVFLAGSPLAGVVFWVPQAGSVGLGVSIFSYAGAVRVGIAADALLVPDPGQVAAAVESEVDDLCSRVLGTPAPSAPLP